MRFALMLLCCTCLGAADVQESILLVGDEQIGTYFSAVGKLSAPTISKRSIRFSDKDKKGLTAADLHKNFERDVLRSKATRVLLGVGAYDLWDFAKKKPGEDPRMAAVLGLITDMIKQLTTAGIEAVLITPPALTADQPEAQAAMASLAEALRALSVTANVRLIDLHALTSGEGSYDKRGKIEKATQERVINALQSGAGLAPTSLPRLVDFDRVVIFSDAIRLASSLEAKKDLELAFKKRYGEKVDLVAVENTADAARKDISVITNQRPRSLLLCFGHRGLLNDVPVDEFRSDLDAVLDALKSTPIDPLILATPIPVSEIGNLGAWQPGTPRSLLCMAYAEAVREIATRRGLPVLDLTSAAQRYLEEVPTASFIAQPDAAKGYAAVKADAVNLAEKELRLLLNLQ